MIKKYEVLANGPLPDDLKVTVIIDLCTKDLREHLELGTKEMKYQEVRDEIVFYVERKRDLFGSQLKAMEVDSHETVNETWWGGGWPEEEYYEEDHHHDHSQYSVQELSYMYNKGYKGKGSKGGGKGKGKSGWFGGWQNKGAPKGQSGENGKGAGAKGDGKGKGGGFQGECHWCGVWGHSQSRCRAKDEYMNQVRANGGGSGVKGGYTQNVETKPEEKTDIGTLENAGGGWRMLCSLERNKFAPLRPEEDEEEDSGVTTAWSLAHPKWCPRILLSTENTQKGCPRNLALQ